MRPFLVVALFGVTAAFLVAARGGPPRHEGLFRHGGVPVGWVRAHPPLGRQAGVGGHGQLPRLHVLQVWDQGPDPRLIADVRGGLAFAISPNRAVELLRLRGDLPPTLVGALPASNLTDARFSGSSASMVALCPYARRAPGPIQTGCLALFDVRDRSRPATIGHFNLESDFQELVAWRDFMLMTEIGLIRGSPGGSLRVLELTGPDAGREVGRLDGGTRRIAVEGDRAYTVRRCGDGDPAALSYDDRNIVNQPSSPDGEPSPLNCLAVVDLTQPSRPMLIGETGLPISAYPSAMAVREGYVYLAVARPWQGIRVIDARGPGAPVLLPRQAAAETGWSTPRDATGARRRIDLAVHGSVLYYGHHTTIAAFDLSQPEAPRPVAALRLGPAASLQRLILDGDQLYVPTGEFKGRREQETFQLWVIDAPGDPDWLPRADPGPGSP